MMAQLLSDRVLVITYFLAGLSLASSQDYTHKNEVDLCHRRPGFEPNGEHLSNPGDVLTVYTNWTNNSPNRVNRCLMRFSTCEYCRLHVQANTSFHYRPCRSPEAYNEYDGWCVPGCTYIHLYDQDYSNQTAATFTSSSSSVSNIPVILDFRTESRFLYVIACSNKTMDLQVFFDLKISSEEKTQYFEDKPWDEDTRGTLRSPFFPSEYVLNSETYKYIFQAATQDDFITISFDDWQLSQYSSILFDRANVKGKIWGSTSRPWIISDGHRLEMTFETGPYKLPGTLRASKGFKATYTFHSKDREEVPYVHTNCGLWIEHQEGGQITFNPKGNGDDYYDCIWVIKKHPDFQRVMVKVINFSTRDNTFLHNQRCLLEIRNGLTSQGRIVESAVPSRIPEDEQFFQYHDSDVGFYVRLKGYYWGKRDFVLSHTSFNFNVCKDLFMCNNKRCVSENVRCDGIDNCGDNSDEAYNTCGSPSKPEYSSPVKVGIIIPIVVSAFLIVVICLLIIFIHRCRRLSGQARQAQRRHLATVSGSVSHQQRRQNRRREEQRMEGGGDHHHLHDPPPSYEDVLNTTPIGYLNLGFSDSTNPSRDPLQPPSYDEAISPTTQVPTLSFQTTEPEDDSSDSSTPLTVEQSQLSTSSSSSGMERGTDQHRHRRTCSSSSSDSSNEGGGTRGEVDRQRRVGRGGDGQRESQDNRQTQNGQLNVLRNITKPEDNQIQLPVCSSADIAHNKGVKSQDKSGTEQCMEGSGPALITDGLISTSTASSLPGPGNEEQPSSVYPTEMSPVISVPSGPSVFSHQGQTAPDGYQEEEGRFSPPGRSRQRHPARANQSHPPQQETSPARQETRGRPSPGRRVPPYILKAKNPSSSTLAKHLSRSMNDLDRHDRESRMGQQHVSMPSRQFSLSMQNMLETQTEGHHRGDEHYPSELTRQAYHHRSQTLPPSESMLHSTAEPVGRNGFSCADGQDRRTRSEDLAERRQDQSRPNQQAYGHQDPGWSNHIRPETLPLQSLMNQAGEEAAPSASRPKPQPKPRRHHPGERTRPEPQRRQFSGGGYGHPEHPRSPEMGERSSNSNIPRSDRNEPSPSDEHRPSRQRKNADFNVSSPSSPHNSKRRAFSQERYQQPGRGYSGSTENERWEVPGYPDKEDRQKAKSSRPSVPPRPERASRSPASRDQEHPTSEHIGSGSEQRHQFGRDQGLPPSSSRGQKLSPPYRRPGPPPYRPRDQEPSRAADLHSQAGPAHHSTMGATQSSPHNEAALRSLYPGERIPRPDHPPQYAQASRSEGPFPKMGVQSVPRSGRNTGGEGPGVEPQVDSGSAPTSPHSPPRVVMAPVDRDAAPVLTSPSSVGEGASAFLSLRMGGEEEEEEDIYV